MRGGTSHILHLLLTVFSLGLWIPIWMLLSIKVGGWRCSRCGTGNSMEMSGVTMAFLGFFGLVLLGMLAHACR